MFDPGQYELTNVPSCRLVERVVYPVVIHVWVNLIATRDPFTCVREESPTSSASLVTINKRGLFALSDVTARDT